MGKKNWARELGKKIGRKNWANILGIKIWQKKFGKKFGKKVGQKIGRIGQEIVTLSLWNMYGLIVLMNSMNSGIS